MVKGWDYEALINTYQKAERICRDEHVPVLVHVTEMTQPQGHSTSGSHERYKSADRLAWEEEFDCIRQFRKYIIDKGYATGEELDLMAKEAKLIAKAAKDSAWKAFTSDIKVSENQALELLDKAIKQSGRSGEIKKIKQGLTSTINPIRMDAERAVRKTLRAIRSENIPVKAELQTWIRREENDNHDRYSSMLYSEFDDSALNVEIIPASYSEKSRVVDGREVLQACFDAALKRDPRVFAFGEDVGKIGDVNQAFAGLQEKYGDLRVTDTGIREATIIGQGIGTALRGLRPIAEIQYLDYLIYALPTLSDDLATLRYRTKAGQSAPLIIRTRGHRLEGVWHAGSPLGMIIHSLRGIYVLVPRNMTQASGMYNTMLRSGDTALIIECLNGYRLKEKVPDNIGEFTVPLGQPEVIREGEDVTVVTYGSMCRIVLEAAAQLEKSAGISVEVIDVQTLLPFDLDHRIVESVKKTNRVIFADEDVPGGASAFMMQQVVEGQGAYRYLDSMPVTISARDHRPAYSSDGDYYSKPNTESVFDAVYAMMHESDPERYPAIY